MKNKPVLIVLLVAILASLGVFYTLEAPKLGNPTAEKKIDERSIEMLFVGDIMFDRGVRTSVVKNLGGDYNKLYENAGYLKEADIAFGNLEGPVATSGLKIGSRFSFRMDPAGLTAMKNAGFDIVSFSNNHVGDYTIEAFKETMSLLDKEGILYAGAGANYVDTWTPRIISVRGVRVGFLAATDVGPDWMKATEESPGILIAKDKDLPGMIANADSKVDVLVVSFHFGDEYSPANSRQEELAKLAIDFGADIVVGHHPHVMQKFEYYNGKPIFYSLGNYIFDQYFSPTTMHGMIGKVSYNPKSKQYSMSAMISPQNDFYVPMEPFPFEEKFLITKRFTP